MRRALIALASLLAALVAASGAATAQRIVAPEAAPAERTVDVLVLGSEPEAIAAAVAAAEAGAETLLVTPDGRLGGLFVLGALNVLDLRTEPRDYQEGIFARWWARVGGGTAFDVDRAERAFEALLAEAGVPVLRARATPLLEAGGVTGARLEPLAPEERADSTLEPLAAPLAVRARHTVDGSADANHAAAAGAGSSFGWESFGVPERMADTLVFRIEGIEWNELRAALRARGRAYANVDERVAWGHFGGVPAAYEPLDPSLRLRGLNLGRQDDGSVLVNALLVYGLDPFDPLSRASGRVRAAREAERVVAYLAERIPGMAGARYGGAAERLYVRETRHLDALCTLTVDDLMDNRVTPLDVAAGGYPMDVQTRTPNDSGFVYGVPAVYGGRLCMHVPEGLDGIWVVGRSAGFDPIAHSSARVVPFGMAQAEAVGVAAALGAERGLTPARMATDPALVGAVRERLLARGAWLPPALPAAVARPPVGPYAHPHYDAYRVLLRRGLALGGYDNDPRLDAPMPALGQLYLLANVARRFGGDAGLGGELIDAFGTPAGPLASDLARALSARAACRAGACPAGDAWSDLVAVGAAPAGFAPASAGAVEGAPLTRGEAYALAAALARLLDPVAAGGPESAAGAPEAEDPEAEDPEAEDAAR